MVGYFEEGGVVLWKGWCGTLKSALFYFGKGSVVLLKMAVSYFKERA